MDQRLHVGFTTFSLHLCSFFARRLCKKARVLQMATVHKIVVKNMMLMLFPDCCLKDFFYLS